MLTLIKVKGVSPDKVSAIHAEVSRLTSQAVADSIKEHPTLKRLAGEVLVKCERVGTETYTKSLENARASLEDKWSKAYGHTDYKGSRDYQSQKAHLEKELEKVEGYKPEAFVDIRATRPRIEIVSSKLTTEGDYEMEIKVGSCSVGIAGSYHYLVSNGYSFETQSSCPLFRFKSDRGHDRPETTWWFEFNPGVWLYGNLFALLGVVPTNEDIELPANDSAK